MWPSGVHAVIVVAEGPIMRKNRAPSAIVRGTTSQRTAPKMKRHRRDFDIVVSIIFPLARRRTTSPTMRRCRGIAKAPVIAALFDSFPHSALFLPPSLRIPSKSNTALRSADPTGSGVAGSAASTSNIKPPKATQSHHKASTKPFARQAVGNRLGTQSHPNAILKPPESPLSATPKPFPCDLLASG
jgi:hypothetical protein